MKYDVVIIGAGPAGSIAAEKLSASGHKTLIIDPCNKKKICAGVLTAQYARKYEVNGNYVEREIKGVRLSFKGIKGEISYRNTVEYSINRDSFDAFNLARAVNNGSELKKNLVLSINEKDSCAKIHTEKDIVLTDYVIVAAGVSELSQLYGGTKQYAYCTQQIKYQEPGDFFEMDLFPGGYSWIVPKKKNVVSGTSSNKDYPDIPGERGLIPINGPVKRTFSNRTILAGDAAGFVSSFDGEGIYYARRSGEIAAEVLPDVISGNNPLSEYEKVWKREFDFLSMVKISRLLSNNIILEAFVREIRDNERFNKVVEDILTKETDKNKTGYIFSLIRKLI